MSLALIAGLNASLHTHAQLTLTGQTHANAKPSLAWSEHNTVALSSLTSAGLCVAGGRPTVTRIRPKALVGLRKQ